jgi:hypothetical protein
VARQPAGRHPLAAGSLVLGLCFCGIALIWLLISTGAMNVSDLQWALPGLLVGAGVIGLVASLRRGSGTPRPARRPRP